MATNAFIGIANTARRIKRMYFGLGDNTPFVEYLSSTNTQYINTGIIAQPEIKINLRLEFTQLNTNQNILGNYINPISCVLYLDGATNKFGTVLKGSSELSNMVAELNTIYNIEFYIGSTKSYCIINGEKIRERSVEITETAYSIFLFRKNSSSDLTGSYIKIYDCKIYHNDTLVRDFVPVLNNSNSPAFYDLVSLAYFNNSGSGTFGHGTIGSNLLGIARKIKKAYVGVNNVARLFFEAIGVIKKASTSVTLSSAKINTLAGHVR